MKKTMEMKFEKVYSNGMVPYMTKGEVVNYYTDRISGRNSDETISEVKSFVAHQLDNFFCLDANMGIK